LPRRSYFFWECLPPHFSRRLLCLRDRIHDSHPSGKTLGASTGDYRF
jgi:hypothetical protein